MYFQFCSVLGFTFLNDAHSSQQPYVSILFVHFQNSFDVLTDNPLNVLRPLHFIVVRAPRTTI